jgi:hypothetical protein
LAVIVFASQYGVIKIETDLGSNKKQTIKLLNQESEKETIIETASAPVSKIVRKGSYEVSVFSGDSNSFSINSINGFFRSTQITPKLKKQNSTEFIGYGADACSYYNGKYAISWGCLSDAASLVIHRPNIGIQATYNDENPYKLSGTIESIFELDGETIALVRGVTTYNGDQIYYKHYYYRLDESFRPVEKIPAKGLRPNKFYEVKSSSNKLVLYDSELSDFYTLDSMKDEPKKIEYSQPTDKSMSAKSVKIYDGKIIIMYSNYAPDIDNDKTGDVLNTFFVIDGDNVKTKELNEIIIDQFSLCSDQYFCIIQNGNMSVYALEGDDFEYSYSVSGVNSIYQSGKNILITKKSGIINFSVSDRSGYYSYKGTGFETCGIRQTTPEYSILCVVDKYNRRSLLKIDLEKMKTSDPSMIVQYLSNLDSVENVSIYKNSISITPEYGNIAYREDLGEHGYDPEFQEKTRSIIRSALSDISESTKNYKIYIIGDE